MSNSRNNNANKSSSNVLSDLVALGATVAAAAGVAYVAYKAAEEYFEHDEQQQASNTNSTSRSNVKEGKSARPPPQPGNECPICRDDLSAPLEILPCNHIYHRVCIREWWAIHHVVFAVEINTFMLFILVGIRFVTRMNCPYCSVDIDADMRAEYRSRLDLL